MITRPFFSLSFVAVVLLLVVYAASHPLAYADDPPAAPGVLYLPLLERGTPLASYLTLATSAYDGDSEIFMLRGDGSALRQLTDNDVADEQPQWSPDGSHILWVQYSGLYPNKSYDDLWIMNSDGSQARPLTQHDGLERGSWSPMGSHIFYYNRVTTGDIYRSFSLYSTTPNGNATLILANTYLQSYRWSPDGSHLLLLLVRQTEDAIVNDLYTVAADGSALTLVTQDVRRAVWSPDGAWIAFDAMRAGNENVYRVRPDGTELRLLTNASMNDRVVNWVDGGARLLIRRTESDWALGRYYLISVDGGTAVPFIMGTPTDDFLSIEGIAPDGKAVVYSTVTNQGYLYLDWQATDSTVSTRISPANCAAGCGVSSVEWSEDSSQLTYAFWQQPVPRIYNTQVYLVDLTSPSPLYHLLDDNALNPVWLPYGQHLALDAAPTTGDAGVRVPHLANRRNQTLTRIPFTNNADFTTAEWRYQP